MSTGFYCICILWYHRKVGKNLESKHVSGKTVSRKESGVFRRDRPNEGLSVTLYTLIHMYLLNIATLLLQNCNTLIGLYRFACSSCSLKIAR